MKRRDFLKLLGLAPAAAVLPAVADVPSPLDLPDDLVTFDYYQVYNRGQWQTRVTRRGLPDRTFDGIVSPEEIARRLARE